MKRISALLVLGLALVVAAPALAAAPHYSTVAKARTCLKAAGAKVNVQKPAHPATEFGVSAIAGRRFSVGSTSAGGRVLAWSVQWWDKPTAKQRAAVKRCTS